MLYIYMYIYIYVHTVGWWFQDSFKCAFKILILSFSCFFHQHFVPIIGGFKSDDGPQRAIFHTFSALVNHQLGYTRINVHQLRFFCIFWPWNLWFSWDYNSNRSTVQEWLSFKGKSKVHSNLTRRGGTGEPCWGFHQWGYSRMDGLWGKIPI